MNHQVTHQMYPLNSIWEAGKTTYYMEMAKVGGGLSIVKVCTSMLCVKKNENRVSVSGWSPIGCN